jgi:uncharacterized protein YciI
MLFVVIAFDKPGANELRLATRAKHLEYIERTKQAKLGGPFLHADGNMIGSLVVIEAENIDAAKEWAANDPYMKAGVFASSETLPWKATVNFCGAELQDLYSKPVMAHGCGP